MKTNKILIALVVLLITLCAALSIGIYQNKHDALQQIRSQCREDLNTGTEYAHYICKDNDYYIPKTELK